MTGFEPPTYPYERLTAARVKAAALPGGIVDLSIGTPTDPPPAAALDALVSADQAGGVRGYPLSVGSLEFRQAAANWMAGHLGVDVGAGAIAACVGTKEFVGTLPQWLKLRTPSRDTVLYPAVSYPTYEMGAILAGCRAVGVPMDADLRMRLDAVDDDDGARALALWVNSPGNPAGQLDDLAAAAEWGRERGVAVFSDECYIEYTWEGPRRTILSSGSVGVVAVHSLSKRSNLAGLRVGWYAGDEELVHYLSEVRKHVGLIVPGAVQLAAAAALSDQAHVEAQRERYWERLVRMQRLLADIGVEAPLPGGGFYLWAPVPGGDAWGFADRMAAEGGALVSPGDIYGAAGAGYVRIAMVQPMDRLELVASRLAV